MTRVAIIEADTPIPAVVSELGTYGTIFTNLLVAAGLSQETTQYSVHHVVEHPENLRRSFHKHRAVSPQAYAQRFGAGALLD